MPPRLHQVSQQLLLLLWLQVARGQLPTLPSRPVHYYCDTPGRDYINQPTDFMLHTRPSGSDRYLPGSRCVFYAITQTPGALYFVQLVNVSMPTANLTIRSDPDDLVRLDRGGDGRASAFVAVTTPRATLTVSFFADSAGDTGGGVGAVLRVRLFVGCPPDWTSLGGYCFGNAGDQVPAPRRLLSFADSQAACRLMQANLLHLPAAGMPGDVGTVTDLHRKLPGRLATNNWIGLTDYTSSGQFSYFWLDARAFYDNGVIGCQSSRLANNRNCKIDERCALYITSLLYPFRTVLMDKCDSRRDFVCFMPAGGATEFYDVPAFSIFSAGAWVWAIVIGCLFGIGVAIGIVYAVLRICHARRRKTDTPV